MLISHDIVEVAVRAGRGGGGSVSFRREAYTPKGGPDGGDGGKGGDVIFAADEKLRTLFDIYRLKLLKGQDGGAGRGKKQTGASGSPLTVSLPVGSEIYEKSSNRWRLVADLTKPGQKIIAALGGKGGWGNWRYATAVNQTPRYAKPGEFGEKKRLKIMLKLMADVGLIGLPNVGKSSILARISHARPKIADYPFTTLQPNLGVVNHKGVSFVVADIPGLIKGAALGKGLGDQFLQHIERTKVLIYILDATSKNLKNDYRTIREELKNYPVSGDKLAKKPELVAVNKIDLNPYLEPQGFTRGWLKVSAVSGVGMGKLLDAVIELLNT